MVRPRVRCRHGQTLPLGVIGNTPDSGSGESWFEPRRGNSLEGWPSGLRRRPAKALDRKVRVGSNPTPSVFIVVWQDLTGFGRVAEWLKAHDWKSCGCKPAWVRIPPRPLHGAEGHLGRTGVRICEAKRSSIPPRPLHESWDPARSSRWSRGVAQSGRALRSGRRGPRFESGRPD